MTLPLSEKKTKLGVTNSGQDYSIVEGDDNATNINRLKAEGIALSKTSKKVQQTTTARRSQTQEKMSKLDEQIRRRSERTQRLREEAEKINAKGTNDYGESTNGKNKKKKEDEIQDDSEDTSTDDDPYNLRKEVANIEAEGAQRVKEVQRTLDDLEASMDETSQSLIAGLRTMYAGRIEQMKESNRRLLATKEQIGIRQGRQRYAQTLNASVLTDEEMAGHDRILELQGEMLVQVAKAQQAREEGKLKMFNIEYDKLDAIYKDTQKEVQDLYTKAVEREKEVRAQAKEERDSAKADLDLMLSKSKSSATGVLKSLEKFTNESDKMKFLEEYAKQSGVDLDILIGDVEKAANDEEKSSLDIRNLRDSIYNRNRRLQMEEEDRLKFGSEDDRKKVKRWLASNGTDTDIENAEKDETFFYWVLNQAEEEL